MEIKSFGYKLLVTKRIPYFFPGIVIWIHIRLSPSRWSLEYADCTPCRWLRSLPLPKKVCPVYGTKLNFRVIHQFWKSRECGIPLYCLAERSLFVSFSMTDSGLCIHHLIVWSNLYFLHNYQWIALPIHSCLVLFSLCANLLHSLIMWLIVSS